MSSLTLDPAALKNYLPHRGHNLLPDQVVMSADRLSAVSTTHIPPNDLRGRELLSRRDRGEGRWWYEPAIAELLAITGVPLLHEQLSPHGQVAVFSMIGKLTMPVLAPLHRPIIGYAQITRNRQGFTSFSTRAEVDGVTVLEAEVMSGSAVLAEVASFPVRPFHGQLPSEPVDPTLLDYKAKHLRFADAVMHVDTAARSLATSYTYPVNHPFCATHFPGAALMMGVTQWGAVADAAWIARARFGLHGPVVAQGTIKRQDGTPVVDVRDLVVGDHDGSPRLMSTKRIAFREPVRPGDGLIVEVTVAPHT